MKSKTMNLKYNKILYIFILAFSALSTKACDLRGDIAMGGCGAPADAGGIATHGYGGLPSGLSEWHVPSSAEEECLYEAGLVPGVFITTAIGERIADAGKTKLIADIYANPTTYQDDANRGLTPEDYSLSSCVSQYTLGKNWSTLSQYDNKIIIGDLSNPKHIPTLDIPLGAGGLCESSLNHVRMALINFVISLRFVNHPTGKFSSLSKTQIEVRKKSICKLQHYSIVEGTYNLQKVINILNEHNPHFNPSKEEYYAYLKGLYTSHISPHYQFPEISDEISDLQFILLALRKSPSIGMNRIDEYLTVFPVTAKGFYQGLKYIFSIYNNTLLASLCASKASRSIILSHENIFHLFNLALSRVPCDKTPILALSYNEIYAQNCIAYILGKFFRTPYPEDDLSIIKRKIAFSEALDQVITSNHPLSSMIVRLVHEKLSKIEIHEIFKLAVKHKNTQLRDHMLKHPELYDLTDCKVELT